MTKDEIIEEIQNWTNEKTEICGNISEEFNDYYGRFLNVADTTYNDFLEEADPSVTFLSIIGGLAEAAVIAIPEKDARYYAIVAAIHTVIEIYQSN